MPILLIANDTDSIRAALADTLHHNGLSVLPLTISPDALNDLLSSSDLPQTLTPQEMVRYHLLQLNFSQKRKGFQYLCAGIPLFAQDQSQLLSKEIYPAIAKDCGNSQPVESVIRRAIKEAWKSRSPEIWDRYFPGCKAAPTNKQFICTLAQMLK